MFYYIFYKYLAQFFHAFNVFQYITFRSIMAILTAFFISLLMGKILIPWLTNIHFSQPYKGYEPVSHKQKSNTPTIGGLIIWSGFFTSSFLWVKFSVSLVWISLLSAFLFVLIGFLDDYFKIKKKKGISAKLKFLLQIIFALIIAVMIFIAESHLTQCKDCLFIPYTKGAFVDLGIFYIPFATFVIVGTSNAVNLTDGLDGLAVGPSLTTSVSLMIFAYISGNLIFSNYLRIPYIIGSGELSVVLSAMIGSLLGFLWYNCYPAEVFMGDTGSLAIGSFLGSIAVMLKEELVLAIAGGIFVFETISVIMQVLSYKTTGERIFKMAPIHHHFEIKGWSESKVIVRFWIISLILALLALTALKLR